MRLLVTVWTNFNNLKHLLLNISDKYFLPYVILHRRENSKSGQLLSLLRASLSVTIMHYTLAKILGYTSFFL